MSFLLPIHSFFRWVVLALGLAGIVVSFYQMRSPRWERVGNAAATAFLAALDLQWLLGIALALATGRPTPPIILHGTVMTFAVALAHILKRMAGNMPPGRILIYRFLAPVVIILAGHLLLFAQR